VGYRIGLDEVVKRKIPSPCRDWNHRSSSPWFSDIPLSYPSSCGVYCIMITLLFGVLIYFLKMFKSRIQREVGHVAGIK
jgi:hypothetical protein